MGNKKQIKIPWFQIIRIIGFDLPDFVESIKAAKALDSDGGKKITFDELRDILYDHFLKEIIPAIVDAIAKSNKIRR